MSNMLELIKKGVKLRKVNQEEAHELSGPPSDEHVNTLKEVMNRMKAKLNPPEEDDDRSSQEQDFDD